MADSGIGIAPQDFAKALEAVRPGRFRPGAQSMKARGWACRLSKQMVELHGGTLMLESKLDVGTTVTVTLPPWRLVARDRAAA